MIFKIFIISIIGLFGLVIFMLKLERNIKVNSTSGIRAISRLGTYLGRLKRLAVGNVDR